VRYADVPVNAGPLLCVPCTVHCWVMQAFLGYTAWCGNAGCPAAMNAAMLQLKLHCAAAAGAAAASLHAEQVNTAAGYSWLRHIAHHSQALLLWCLIGLPTHPARSIAALPSLQHATGHTQRSHPHIDDVTVAHTCTLQRQNTTCPALATAAGIHTWIDNHSLSHQSAA
jgi:hypothetical protein